MSGLSAAVSFLSRSSWAGFWYPAVRADPRHRRRSNRGWSRSAGGPGTPCQACLDRLHLDERAYKHGEATGNVEVQLLILTVSTGLPAADLWAAIDELGSGTVVVFSDASDEIAYARIFRGANAGGGGGGGRQINVVRRFMSKKEYKMVTKRGLVYNPVRGGGIPTTTPNFWPKKPRRRHREDRCQFRRLAAGFQREGRSARSHEGYETRSSGIPGPRERAARTDRSGSKGTEEVMLASELVE